MGKGFPVRVPVWSLVGLAGLGCEGKSVSSYVLVCGASRVSQDALDLVVFGAAALEPVDGIGEAAGDEDEVEWVVPVEPAEDVRVALLVEGVFVPEVGGPREPTVLPERPEQDRPVVGGPRAVC